MRKRTYGFVTAALVAIAAYMYFQPSHITVALAAPQAGGAASAASPCAFPTKAAATPEQTAWQIFVAANCQANKTQLVWETWIEQLDLYPASGKIGAAAARARGTSRRLHGSPLTARRSAALSAAAAPQLVPSEECNKMNGPPPNVISGATICEEARLNPAAQEFITTATYQIRSGQTAAAKKGTDIEFPDPAVEVKVDWVPAADFNPAFSCTQPPAGVHVETIDGACYAMAGIHISSKLLKDWLWATFEPQSMLTNPLRCITFGPCSDAWGSVPATSKGGSGGFTKQTPALAALMKAANLAPEFSNYTMDGAQTMFTNADGSPTYLGNSVIEGENVGLKLNQASCITCHSVSSIQNTGTDGIKFLNNQVGKQYQVPKGWIARDFVWSMGLACPGGIQNCAAVGASGKK